MRVTSFVRPHVVWLLTILALVSSVGWVAHSYGHQWYHKLRERPGEDGLWTTTVLNRRKKTVVVDIVAENRTVHYTYNERERYYKDLPPWLDRYSFLPAPHEVPDEQRICMVHVGACVCVVVVVAVLRCMYDSYITTRYILTFNHTIYILYYFFTRHTQAKQPATPSAVSWATRRTSAVTA